MSTPPTWLCLHFPRLAVEVFTHGSGQHDQPVVILERARVMAINDAADELGVRIGSSLATAYTVSNGLASFERNPDRELTTLQRLAGWAYQFTSQVAVHAPDCLLLDISGSLRLFGGSARLKSLVAEGLAEQGYTASIGINATPLAAECAALGGLPDNLAGTVAGTLDPLPVSHLRVEPRIIEGLAKTGIHTVAQLLALPVAGLSRRFGVFFADYLQRLTGASPDPQKFISEAPAFNSDLTFIPEVTNLESLLFPIKRLLGELSAFLALRQLHVNRLTFTLAHRSHESRQISVYLASPANDTAMFLMLTQLQLDKVDDMPEVDNLALTTGAFFPAESGSGDLFQGGGPGAAPTSKAGATRLVNQLRNRLGAGACFGLSEANDHRPEKAWQPVRMNERQYWQPTSPVTGAPRPLLLLPSPRALRTVNGGPWLSGELECLRGPERIDTGWWDTAATGARDYYVCRHPAGSLYWLYRLQATNTWYLHGIFS